MAALNDFFASTVDESVVDSTIAAFSNQQYDITNKQRTTWQRSHARKSKAITKSKSSQKASTDRFIPLRDGNHFDAQQSYKEPGCAKKEDDDKEDGGSNFDRKKSKILSFAAAAPEAADGYISNLRTLYTVDSGTKSSSRRGGGKSVRHICQTAQRVLDAPDLRDDYYLNLLHWGRTNAVAIGLGSSLYLWDAADGQISLLVDLGEEMSVCSVRWNHNGQYIAVGDSNATVTLYDAKRAKRIRKLRGHSARVGSLAWNHSVLSTGSADGTVRNNDVRMKDPAISPPLQCHEQEICGLTWNGQTADSYLASGSNDNKVCVWRLNEGPGPLCEFTESLSAVKALAFCPWNSSLLATGGGSADRKIRIYDVAAGSDGNLCKQIDAESQVSSLIWNPFEKELLSAHGFSKNQLTVWKYPTMQRTHDLTGHTARILSTTLSPNGKIVCSAAADETLRFWEVFEEKKHGAAAGYSGGGGRIGAKNNGRKSNNALNLRIR